MQYLKLGDSLSKQPQRIIKPILLQVVTITYLVKWPTWTLDCKHVGCTLKSHTLNI